MTEDIFDKGDVMISRQWVMEEKRKKFGVELSGLVVTGMLLLIPQPISRLAHVIIHLV